MPISVHQMTFLICFPSFFLFHVVSKSHSLVYQAVHDRANLSGGIYKYIVPITASVNLNTNGKTEVNPHFDEVCAACGQMNTFEMTLN